ncbi:hypothetical protein BBJ28_00022418 [Nothophytophthora sp. Chile5]|nr:hypothetical protein BBJ28_00022418 [Nothophytophthora sp. Chile5]
MTEAEPQRRPRLRLRDAQALVAKYQPPRASHGGSPSLSPTLLVRKSFGNRSGKSWLLAPTELWVGLAITETHRGPVRRAIDQQSMAYQIQARRALLELICQLSGTPSFRWTEHFESMWQPSTIGWARPSDAEAFDLQQIIGPAPKFALSFGWPTLESVHRLFEFLQMDPQRLLSDEHRHLLATLQGSKRLGSRPQKHRIELCLNIAGCSIGTAVLRSLVDNMRGFLEPNGDLEASGGGANVRVQFQVTTIWWENCRFLTASDDLELLAQLVTLPSSAIRSLLFPGAFFNAIQSPSGLGAFQSFARQVLMPSSPLRSLDLTRTQLYHKCISSLCSALRYSNRLQQLSIAHSIRGAHANTPLVWAWIFLGIFHADSDSELQHLDVSGLPLQALDLELLTAMLASPHPGKTLVLLHDGRLPEGEGCEECALPVGQRLFVQLLRDSKVWSSPGSAVIWPQLVPGKALADDFEYEVLVRLADWLCLLIPGYGYGWVVSSAVRDELTRPSRVTATAESRTRPAVQSLTYHGMEGLSSHVVGLLDLVGHSLISLDVPSSGLNAEDLDVILQVCPQLSKLNVAGNAVTDLSPILRAYMENRCRITSLSVLVEAVTPVIAAQVRDLLVHPNAKWLENLQLASVVQGGSDHSNEREIWTEIQHALSANSTLRYLGLTLPSTNSREVAAALLTPFRGQMLRYETPMRLKTAFLSVVQHPSSPSSVRSLDRMALSIIFEFATTFAVRRQVQVDR